MSSMIDEVTPVMNLAQPRLSQDFSSPDEVKKMAGQVQGQPLQKADEDEDEYEYDEEEEEEEEEVEKNDDANGVYEQAEVIDLRNQNLGSPSASAQSEKRPPAMGVEPVQAGRPEERVVEVTAVEKFEMSMSSKQSSARGAFPGPGLNGKVGKD